MSNEGATPEELPDTPEYQKKYREAVKKLIRAGKKRCRGLHGTDVIGVYLAAAAGLAERNMPGLDFPGLLRHIADGMDEKKSNRTVN